MEMNMQEISIGLNILNILKDCQRICGNFIFTAVCHAWAKMLKTNLKLAGPLRHA